MAPGDAHATSEPRSPAARSSSRNAREWPPENRCRRAGWFGPSVRDEVRGRIGDLVMAAVEAVGVFQRDVDPLQSSLVGHHGSMTPVEQLVPWIVVRT